jgi:hypothetical protein
MKNILCTNCNNTGDNVLVYAPDQITPAKLEKALQNVGFFLSDCFEVSDNDLQYYCIDDRLTLSASLVRSVENLQN